MGVTKTTLLKGAPVAAVIMNDVKNRVLALNKTGVEKIGCSIICFGEKKDDLAYIGSIRKKAEEVGIAVKTFILDECCYQKDAEQLVKSLSSDIYSEELLTHGILILRPVPSHIDEEKLFSKLVADKDIDGVTIKSKAFLYSGSNEGFLPCTAQACMELLHYYNIGIEGKNAVIIGRSEVIGKPISMLLLKENATVTICHSKTKDIEKISRNADILVCALGRGEAITREYMSEKQVILDVGINFNAEGKMVGDVKYSDAEGFVGAITPVPGGVGSITTACLLSQVVKACEEVQKRKKQGL